MRLRSLVIQVLVRRIKTNHSPEDAAKLLFAEHPHGLPRRTVVVDQGRPVRILALIG
jgi:hypothetical protein